MHASIHPDGSNEVLPRARLWAKRPDTEATQQTEAPFQGADSLMGADKTA